MPKEVIAFKANFLQSEIDDLRWRLAHTRWPDPETCDDWSQGLPRDYLQEICEYWAHDYDMDRPTARLNAFEQVVTEIDGLRIHSIHARSAVPGARPLLITHGWPGSVVEFLDVIPALTDPEAHGGKASDAFHVICPSLPGFGYSGKPTQPGWSTAKIAQAWLVLMTRLGYAEFALQGGDWGSDISLRVARLAPERVVGVHLSLGVGDPQALLALGDLTKEEQDYLARMQTYAEQEVGYSAIQGTRPQTLGYGLTDSPAGQCAWILEKFKSWTDCDGHPENAISRDILLDNICTYWFTQTASSSARLYWENSVHNDGQANAPVDAPIGYTLFPKDLFALSERWAETRFKNLKYYSVAERGGHFASLEQPEKFVEEVRRAFRQM